MCNQFTLHHKFRIDTGKTKFKQGKTDSIFTAVNPMDKEYKDPYKFEFDQNHVLHGTSRNHGKDTKTRCIGSMYSLLNVKESKFYQTGCNAIILYDTLPAYCISKVVVMESGEIIYEKVYVSPRPPPTIPFKDNWMKELDSDIAGSSKDTQRIQPKPKNPIVKNGETRGWTTVHPGGRKRCVVWSRKHQTLNKNGETRGWTNRPSSRR